MGVLAFIGGLVVVSLLLIGLWWAINNVSIKDTKPNPLDDDVGE